MDKSIDQRIEELKMEFVIAYRAIIILLAFDFLFILFFGLLSSR